MITQAEIEAAAIALAERWLKARKWDWLTDLQRETYRRDAKAVLEAARLASDQG